MPAHEVHQFRQRQRKTQTLPHDRLKFPPGASLPPSSKVAWARLQAAGHVHRVQPERSAQPQFKVRARLAPLQAALHLAVTPLQAKAALQAPVLKVRHALAVLFQSRISPESPSPISPGIWNSGHSGQQKRRQQAESCLPHKEKRWATWAKNSSSGSWSMASR